MGADKGLRIMSANRFNLWQTFLENMMTIFGMDKRSLALYRVFLGLTVIGDVINRWSDIRAHYTDEGFMPRFMVLQYFHNDSWITLHMAAGTTPFIAVLFFLHIVFAALYVVGYWTKLNGFLCWIWTLSLHNRNIFVLHGGDLYMRCIMFFALFLPVGDCYSVDNMLKNKKPYRLQKGSNGSGGSGAGSSGNQYNFLHVACTGMVIQMMCVYCTSYMHKTGAEWREIGTATWLALQLDYFRTPIGDFMLNFPELLKFLTFKVLWWEGFGVVFLFVPIFSGPIRTFGVLGFVAMHLGFAFALRLGQFGCCGTFGVLIMLPNVQWYYNIEGELDNGTKVELWANEGMTRWELHPHTWDKPDPLWINFKNHRWFKYYENGFNTARNNDQLRLNFGRYICREMNARHRGGEQLYKFSIHWMSERVDPNTPNQRFPQPKQTLWNHLCYERPGGN